MSKKVNIKPITEYEIEFETMGDHNMGKMIATIIEENIQIISSMFISDLGNSDKTLRNNLHGFILNAIPELLERNPKYASTSVKLCLTRIKHADNLNDIKGDILHVLEKSLKFLIKED